MTLYQIASAAGSFAADNPGLVIFVLLSLVEITPIKVSPWSWLLRRVGMAAFPGVWEEINGIKVRLGEIQEEARKNAAEAARSRILCFGDEVYREVRHSKEHFDHILADIRQYNAYCRDHPEFQNDMTVLTADRIKLVYRECMAKHTFL